MRPAESFDDVAEDCHLRLLDEGSGEVDAEGAEREPVECIGRASPKSSSQERS